MSVEQVTSVSGLRPLDGLAEVRAGLFRLAMTKNPPIDAVAKLRRAKERLYVLCQVAGWSLFMVSQLAFLPFTDKKDAPHDKLVSVAIIVMVGLMGLLLSHYVRPFMTRRGWKELGWRPLIPRVLATSGVLSAIWSGVGYGYIYGVVCLAWTAKYSLALVIFLSWLNGFTLFIGWLCIYFFYHLFERLNRLQLEQLRLAANVKEAELRALKSQLNPHFLFNSLNSLRALIDEDAPRAREAVTRLANMLRYSLQSGQQETVPFEEELRIVEDYLALEQIRHENRLSVRWDIAAEVRALSVPPMLLQTLVENAVKYGIGPRREGGEIAISARLDTAVLHICVTNPGDLAEPVSPAVARAGSSTGVGLRNASERLRLLFGDQATLTLLAEPPGCVTVDVLIPVPPAAS
ncbi:MAG: sensor histidine kinase [bacterium]|nr:sensor histidine kinase [bacterium]